MTTNQREKLEISYIIFKMRKYCTNVEHKTQYNIVVGGGSRFMNYDVIKIKKKYSFRASRL